MHKRGALIIFLSLLLFSFGAVHAQDETNDSTIFSEVELEYPDAKLQTNAGISPDSFFYFFDSFFDRFGDDLIVREERIAEIREMIRGGKIEEAREALERYEALADKLEAEIDPEKRDEARRGAAAIRNAILEIASEIPDEFKEEFISSILEREEAIITSAEISSRIKELCESLSEIDPLEYSRVCKIDDDSPEWNKQLDRELTEEQRAEAIKFGEIMSECFKTSGQQCRCDEIPFTEFAEMCSVAAPLATACEINDNETACEQLDNLEMPELPPHLQDVFDSFEGDIAESQFEVHMPRECREAGATNSKECMKIMIKTNAPEECRDALIEADVKNEREAREICEKIMFELNAPEECIEAGVRDPKECGKLMFQQNAPEECIKAGLTGENRGDEKKCRTIMESQGEGPRGFGPPALGIRCREISNPEERLSCYDAALSGAEGNYVEHRGESSRGWPEPCQEANALTRESCEAVMRERGEQQRQEFEQFQPSSEFVEPQPQQEFTEPLPTTSGEGTTSVATGAVIINNNGFFRYYFR